MILILSLCLIVALLLLIVPIPTPWREVLAVGCVFVILLGLLGVIHVTGHGG